MGRANPPCVVASQQPLPCVSNSTLPTSSSAVALEQQALSLFLEQLNSSVAASPSMSYVRAIFIRYYEYRYLWPGRQSKGTSCAWERCVT